MDCNSALELDNRCSAAYSVRADVLLGLHQGDDDNDGLCCAAKDAMRGFLLSGSINLELASKSEDIAREVCRVESKQVFNRRITLRKYIAKNETSNNSSYTLRKDRLPRTWLVSSYLLGYEPLERGLELDSDRAKKISELNAVTDENPDTPAVKGIAPPQHLLDLDALEIYRQCNHYAYELLQNVAKLLQETVQSKDSSEFADNVIPINCIENLQDIDIDADSDEIIEITPLLHSDSLVNDNSNTKSVTEFIEELQQIMTPSSDDSSADMGYCSGYLDAYLLLTDAKVVVNSIELEFVRDILGLRIAINSYGAITVDVINKELFDNEKEPLISKPLRARFLNVISSIAFLAGDAIGAVNCLRESHAIDDRLMDTYVKLGCLLIDMDELEEVSEYI